MSLKKSVKLNPKNSMYSSISTDGDANSTNLLPKVIPNTIVFCKLCNINIVECSLKEHEKSTLHLFSLQMDQPPRTVWLEDSNPGYQMLQRMGWKQGKGLGREEEGILEPIPTHLKRDRKGIGAYKKRLRVTHSFSQHKTSNFSEKVVSKKSLKQERLRIRRQENSIKNELCSWIPDEYLDLFK